MTQLINEKNSLDMDDNEKKSFLEEFIEGFKEEYEKEDKDKDKDKPLDDKVIDGATTGIVEALANPFSWIKSLIK